MGTKKHTSSVVEIDCRFKHLFMYRLLTPNMQQVELGNAHIPHTQWPNSPVLFIP